MSVTCQPIELVLVCGAFPRLYVESRYRVQLSTSERCLYSKLPPAIEGSWWQFSHGLMLTGRALAVETLSRFCKVVYSQFPNLPSSSFDLA
jgi:hypothetical protein